MIANGFRFNRMMDARRKKLAALRPTSCRGWARVATTNRPPAPAVTMLGEIVVAQRDDPGRSALPNEVDSEALIACLEMYKNASFSDGHQAAHRGSTTRGDRRRLDLRHGPRSRGKARWRDGDDRAGLDELTATHGRRCNRMPVPAIASLR